MSNFSKYNYIINSSKFKNKNNIKYKNLNNIWKIFIIDINWFCFDILWWTNGYFECLDTLTLFGYLLLVSFGYSQVFYITQIFGYVLDIGSKIINIC